MHKQRNVYGHYVLAADKGKSLTNGEIYTRIYISKEDINESDWTEVDVSEVPALEEDDTAMKAAAFDVLMGVEA